MARKETCIYKVSASNIDSSLRMSKGVRHYANLADAQQYMRQLMRDIGLAHNKAMLMDKGYTEDMAWTGRSSLTHASGSGRLTQLMLRLSEYEEKWEAWDYGYQVQIVSVTVEESCVEEEVK